MLRFQFILFNKEWVDDEAACCWLMSGANGRGSNIMNWQDAVALRTTLIRV